MALNTIITSAAEKIAADLNGGAPASRQSFGGGGVAFGWASGAGLPRTVANYCTTATADGMAFPITRVTVSGTPAAKVGPGAQKPTAGQVASSSVALEKFSGLAIANLEDFLSAEGLASAIASVLGASCLQAFEADAIAQIDAAVTAPVTGADWVAAVAAGQAAVLSAGGAPSVLVVSAADYGAFLADVAGSLAVDPSSPVGSLFGSVVHISSGAPTGKAYIFDAASVIAVQHVTSPIAIVDSVSMAGTNQTKVIIDLVAKAFVVNAALVAEITPPLAARGTSAKR